MDDHSEYPWVCRSSGSVEMESLLSAVRSSVMAVSRVVLEAYCGAAAVGRVAEGVGSGAWG